MYVLRFSRLATSALADLERNPVRLKRVRKTLAFLEANPRHPGLNSHPYENFPGHPKGKVWDSYVDQGAGAWRVFWRYGPNDPDDGSVRIITVLDITPHP